MKCIKSKTTGEIKRVTDETACKLETKGWVYVPKSEWKKTIRPDAGIVKTIYNKDGKPRRNREKSSKK
jgi:hypothetical protein